MKKLHMIGNAHLDLVWLWPWQEGFQENKATFQSMLDRLDEYDDVVFTSSSAQCYEWVEHNDPAMFEKIARRIREGRWVLCGGWWVQPDCNIPCGESFARQALLGQNYFREKFGVTATVGYNVDSFGHHGMMPQLLRLSGLEHYVFMRPGPHEKGMPARNFIWESDDGSRVTAFRLPFTYCAWDDLEGHIRACEGEFDAGVDQLMSFYGVGNHGGGPTIANIEAVRALGEKFPDLDIRFSDPGRYFRELKDKEHLLPVVHGDLQHHASGCYSAHSEIKRMNRRSENSLLRAERFASLSAILGRSEYPADFEHAWKQVLLNQFHDTLAGSGIERAYDDSRNQLGEAISIADRNENNALQAISFAVDIPKEDSMLPVVVFNPHSWEANVPVEMESGMFGNLFRGSSFRVVDSDGNELPCQRIRPDAMTGGRWRIVFPAKIPALGHATFRVYVTDAAQPYTPSACPANVLENERMRVRFCETTGHILSIYDKAADLELAGGPCARPVVMEDKSDTWSHAVFRFDKQIGEFSAVSVKKVEDGPVRSSVRVISKYGASTLVQTFTLYRGGTDLHVAAKVNWQEKFQCLKLRFPVNLDQYEPVYEIPFGVISRAAGGEEEAMQKWMDLSGLQHDDKRVRGLAILNDSKYSAAIEGNVMDLMVLRSPVYAHHDPFVLEDEIDDYSFIDQGIQSFRYVIAPHMGGWREAGIVRKAQELNLPCPSVTETYHQGAMPQRMGSITIDAPNVLLSSFKRAHSGDGYVIRFYECHGQGAEVGVDLPCLGKTIRTAIRPWEIKTFAVSADPGAEPVELNLLEWPVAPETQI